jgi:hypothetical protein
MNRKILKGLSDAQRDRLVTSVSDWIDADSLVQKRKAAAYRVGQLISGVLAAGAIVAALYYGTVGEHSAEAWIFLSVPVCAVISSFVGGAYFATRK